MKKSLTTAGAMLVLAAFASTAQAGMAMNMSTSMSRGGDTHMPVTSSLGSGHTFSPDGHSFTGRTFSPDGRTFSPDGLQGRVKGSNWKKPIDSDQGGGDDPPKKTPKDPTQTTDNGGGGTYPHHPYYGSGGWYDHHHPQNGGSGGGTGNVPQRTAGVADGGRRIASVFPLSRRGEGKTAMHCCSRASAFVPRTPICHKAA